MAHFQCQLSWTSYLQTIHYKKEWYILHKSFEEADYGDEWTHNAEAINKCTKKQMYEEITTRGLSWRFRNKKNKTWAPSYYNHLWDVEYNTGMYWAFYNVIWGNKWLFPKNETQNNITALQSHGCQ